MIKKNIFKIILTISLCLNLIYLANIIVIDYEFTSSDDFNNITTPIIAIIALIFACLSWLASNETNKITKSEFMLKNITDNVNNIFDKMNKLKLHHEGLENLNNEPIEFRNYISVLSHTVIKLKKLDFFKKIKDLPNDSYWGNSKNFDSLPDNINTFYNSKVILDHLSNLEYNLNKSKDLIPDHRYIFIELFTNMFINMFEDYLIEDSSNPNIYMYYNKDKVELRALKDFDIPKKVNEINLKITHLTQ